MYHKQIYYVQDYTFIQTYYNRCNNQIIIQYRNNNLTGITHHNINFYK